LQASYGFTGEWYDHSGEFNRAIQEPEGYLFGIQAAAGGKSPRGKLASENFKSKFHFQTTAWLSHFSIQCRKSVIVRHPKMAWLSHSLRISIYHFSHNYAAVWYLALMHNFINSHLLSTAQLETFLAYCDTRARKEGCTSWSDTNLASALKKEISLIALKTAISQSR
jgi:hypothetical protein